MRSAILRLGPALIALPMVATCAPSDADASGARATVEPSHSADAAPTAELPRGVLGTLEATVGGETRTWYVVSGDVQGTPYASAAWFETESGVLRISLGGFATQTPPLDTFERGPMGDPVSFGSYEGPVLSLLLSAAGEIGPFRAELPGDDNPTSFAYMSAARFGDLDVLYTSRSGTVDVTLLELADGRLRAEGTFSGTLESAGTGPSLEITDGHFSVRGVPSLTEISPAAAVSGP